MGSSKTQGELWGAAAERWAAEQERVCRPLWLDVCDLESLSYADESFDAVMAINSVFYCENQAAAMRELCRVTRRGGLVGVTAWGPPAECEMRVIFQATNGLLPPPPPGSAGPVLSDPGVLESSLSTAGLTPHVSGRSHCPFEYDGVASVWSAQSSSGPVQRVVRVAGEEAVRRAFFDAAAGYIQTDGRVVFQNVFLWAIGQRA